MKCQQMHEVLVIDQTNHEFLLFVHLLLDKELFGLRFTIGAVLAKIGAV